MSSGTRRRGEYAKSADRRAEIVQAAVAVFADGGFKGGTIREIAERVGMSQAGLLHHFSSKEKLLEAVLDHRDELALRLFGEQWPVGIDLLRAMLDLVAFNTTSGGLVALFTVLSGEATAPDHPGHEYFRARYATIRGWLEEAVRVAQQHGTVREDVAPQVAARTIIAIMDGLQVQWLYEDRSFDMAGPLRAYLRTLLVDPSQVAAVSAVSSPAN